MSRYCGSLDKASFDSSSNNSCLVFMEFSPKLDKEYTFTNIPKELTYADQKP